MSCIGRSMPRCVGCQVKKKMRHIPGCTHVWWVYWFSSPTNSVPETGTAGSSLRRGSHWTTITPVWARVWPHGRRLGYSPPSPHLQYPVRTSTDGRWTDDGRTRLSAARLFDSGHDHGAVPRDARVYMDQKRLVRPEVRVDARRAEASTSGRPSGKKSLKIA